MPSSDCGAPEGTELKSGAYMDTVSHYTFVIIPAVKVLAYIGPVENTLPPLNPVWLTVKL